MELETDMDALPGTQTQEEYIIESSQEAEEVERPWGRLCSRLQTLQSVELYENTYTFGRAPNCNILIEKSHFPSVLNVSKKHFQLHKDIDDIVYITDTSKNGTFINRIKLGRNKSHIINDEDVIAIGHPTIQIYSFSYNINHEDCNYPIDMRNKYFISKKIGRGAFGEVRLAHDKTSFKKFAIKKINKSHSSSSVVGRVSPPQKIKTEIEILTSLTYTFIIQMNEVFETDKEVYLVLEYMQGGELTSRILSTTPFPEAEVKFVFYQILLAVRYLHWNGITHRDLKPENVLLYSNDPYPMVKVSDFGLSKVMDGISLMETMCGTLHYVAPEVINGCERYRKNVDIWSMGVILFYMLSKKQPFTGSDREEVGRKILAGKVEWDTKAWRGISMPAKELTRKILIVDRERRINMLEIFRHTWIERDSKMRNRVEQFMAQSYDDSGSSEETLCKRIRLSGTD